MFYRREEDAGNASDLSKSNEAKAKSRKQGTKELSKFYQHNYNEENLYTELQPLR